MNMQKKYIFMFNACFLNKVRFLEKISAHGNTYSVSGKTRSVPGKVYPLWFLLLVPRQKDWFRAGVIFLAFFRSRVNAFSHHRILVIQPSRTRAHSHACSRAFTDSSVLMLSHSRTFAFSLSCILAFTYFRIFAFLHFIF